MSPIVQLLKVQDLDMGLARLEREAADIPARRAQVESRLHAHREALAELEEAQLRETAAARQIELEVETLEGKITKFREQQFQIKNNEEYRALEREIAVTQERIREMEDREIERLEKQENLAARIVAARKALAGEEEEVARDNTVLAQRGQEIEKEKADLGARRAEAAETVEARWLSRYERIFKHHGDKALVSLEGYVCGGCHMQLAPQKAMDARQHDRPTLCDFCGRLLYRP